MLVDALEHLVRGIVSYPGDVSVVSRKTVRGPLLQIRSNPDDIGRIIGRSGKTINALRIVINALSGGVTVRVDVLDKLGR
jgi:predicted RNA-binding protein YlqC (UPF0109 family)